MCNACGNQCCGSDEFGGCGCDHCHEPECQRDCDTCGMPEPICDCFDDHLQEDHY